MRTSEAAKGIKVVRRLRIIDVLRKAYPGKWRYEWPSTWIGPEFTVTGYSASYSSCEVDDKFITEYWKDNPHERVPELIHYGRIHYS